RGLQENGTYGRWLQFAYDMRSDVGFSRSPWGDLANFTKSVLASYDFEVNREIWQHHYQAIFRANQVIAYVPGIDMNAATRDRIVGEAKFIRALMYFNLVNLFGNVPLNLKTSVASDRPAQVTAAETWAQIEKDLTEAMAVLPGSYTNRDVGRATRWAAQALLGRAHLQQREWAAAQAALGAVAGSGQFSLVPDYRSNFTEGGDNNAESIFEVQFGGPEVLATGSRGQNMIKMLGPCAPNGPSFCDGDVTAWYAAQFNETTVGGGSDPRLDATVFLRGTAYNRPYSDYFGSDAGRRFWIKYGEFYKNSQDWDNPINVKVMRLGGVLLQHAEAAFMAGQEPAARASVNAVRVRAGLQALAGPVTLEIIEREQLRELGFENERWLFLARHNWLTEPAKIAVLASHDSQFNGWTAKQALLPIPNLEVDLNPNVQQNPGW
ncbi:MAG TPA: RagB/SusD family nutrient uptake outer membrane protein, partial [Roseiflexaceae bacterium]|nr:RagB/SusD family nutrient uptake outer membrane protein [Roseiflexaceae bacterium]